MHCRQDSRKFVYSFVAGAVFVIGAGCSGNVGRTSADEAEPNGEDPGDGDSKPAVSACGGTPKAAVGQWRRLTATQYASTVRALLGQTPQVSSFLADSRTGPFKTNTRLPVQENDVGNYSSTAAAVATKAVANMSGLLNGCTTAAPGGEDKCAAQFIKDFGARAFRRPLLADEEAALTTVYKTGKEENFTTGIRLVVQATLQSPSFLYLVETGRPDPSGLRKLSGYEIASRLSYLFTGTMPSADLFAAAREGKLDSSAGVRSAAEKLLSSPNFIGQVANFHAELIGVEDLRDTTAVSKSPKFTSTFDIPMRTAMLEESRKFVDYVMTKGSGSVQELLSANYVFPEGPLVKIYGSNAKPGSDGRAVINDGTRKGLLTLAANLAVHPKQYSPSAAVNRGHLVRRDFLCETVPPPTVAVDFTPPPGAEKLTAQELLREHQENPTCSGCHRLMDSIGFALESYDAVGAYRTKDDGGNNIDPSGEIVDLQGDGHFRNAGEMAEILAISPEVRTCMSTQWFRFALGRDPDEADSCTQEQVKKAFLQGKGDIKEAILSLVASDSFRLNGGQ